MDPVPPAPAPPSDSRICDRVPPHPILATRIARCLSSPTPTPGAVDTASPHKSRRLRVCRARRRLLPFRAGRGGSAVPRGSAVGRPEGEPAAPMGPGISLLPRPPSTACAAHGATGG